MVKPASQKVRIKNGVKQDDINIGGLLGETGFFIKETNKNTPSFTGRR